jgi:Uma2 family endonuclease
MKAVMPSLLPDIQAIRKKTGADQWDEMWEGVLHMPPAPTRGHQDLEGSLESYLRFYWTPTCQGKVYHQINVAAIGGWPDNYRIPDVVLHLPERFAIDRNEYFEGAPDAVVEIHSPGDEAYEKLPFYRDLGVPEVWIIHRDSREPETYVLKRNRYTKQTATAQGWVRSPHLKIEMAGMKGKLAVRLAGDDATRQDLPLD